MAFHPKPQLIPDFFNRRGFGPPAGVTPPSAWPWLDHSVSGLLPATRRPVRTRFRSAFTSRLKLAANRNSRTHYTKGTPSPLRAPTACRRSVSGLFHSPHRGAFHLSLTVLVHYRSLGSIQAWRVVPPRSDRVSRAPPYSRIHRYLRIRGYHPLWPDFPDRSAYLL